MTEPCGKGLGVLLAESVQQGNRSVSRELLPLPLPFLENEHVESEHLRCLSRAVRSRVVRRVGWQGWANDGVRSMNEIYSKTSASEAGSWSSSPQPASLSRICSAYEGVSAAECKSARKPSKRFAVLCLDTPTVVSNRPPSRRVSFPCPTHVRRWQMVLTFKTGTDFGSLEGLVPGFASFAKRASRGDRAGSPKETRDAMCLPQLGNS